MKFIIMSFKIILSYKNVSLYAYSLYLGIRVIMCKCFEKNNSTIPWFVREKLQSSL